MIELSLHRTPGSGRSPDRTTPLSRRGFLHAAFGGAGGLATLAQLHADAIPAPATAVIQIWLAGGPSHIDLYDLKPHAPADNRGPFRPIATAVPGSDVCELLPLHADIMQHLTVVRSLHHDSHDHVAGTHWMQTGAFGPTSANPVPTHPSFGSGIAHVRQTTCDDVVPYVHLRPDLPIDLYSRQFNAQQLGPAFDPLHVIMPFPGYGNQVRFDLPAFDPLPGLPPPRMDRRMSLRDQFDDLRRTAEQNDKNASRNGFYRRALDLVASQNVRNAFDLAQESPSTRERYGPTGWGQAALLCRRLVEAGVTFVTLNTDSSSNLWDNHAQVEYYFKIMLPAYDRMLSALITDLVERGLYDRVILLVWGEFGRTPFINERGGRDHWGHAGCALLGGAGLRNGTVFGATAPRGDVPRDNPVRPADILATVSHLLGVDPARPLTTRSGRTIPLLSEGEPIRELIA